MKTSPAVSPLSSRLVSLRGLFAVVFASVVLCACGGQVTVDSTNNQDAFSRTQLGATTAVYQVEQFRPTQYENIHLNTVLSQQVASNDVQQPEQETQATAPAEGTDRA